MFQLTRQLNHICFKNVYDLVTLPLAVNKHRKPFTKARSNLHSQFSVQWFDNSKQITQ